MKKSSKVITGIGLVLLTVGIVGSVFSGIIAMPHSMLMILMDVF